MHSWYSERDWISWHAIPISTKSTFSKEYLIPWRDWLGCKRPLILLNASLKLLSKLCTLLVSMTSSENLFSPQLSSWVSDGFSCSFPWPLFEGGSDIFHHFAMDNSQNYHCTESHAKGKDAQKWTTDCLSGLHITVYELGVDSMFTSMLSEGEETDSTSWVQAQRQADTLVGLQAYAVFHLMSWLPCCQT